MLNLPSRQAGYSVDVVMGDPPEVVATFLMAALDDDEFMDLVEDPKVMAMLEGAADDPDDPDAEAEKQRTFADVPVRKLLSLFAQKVTGAEGVQVEGEDFDPTKDAHLISVPRGLKIQVATGLLTQQFTIQGLAGNLNAPDASLPEGTSPEVIPDVSGA